MNDDLRIDDDGTQPLMGGLEPFLQSTARSLGWDGVELWRERPDGRMGREVVWCEPELRAYEAELPLLLDGEGAPYMATRTGRLVWITDVTTEQTLTVRARLSQRYGVRTICACPVSGPDGRWRVLLFFSRSLIAPALDRIKPSTSAAQRLLGEEHRLAG